MVRSFIVFWFAINIGIHAPINNASLGLNITTLKILNIMNIVSVNLFVVFSTFIFFFKINNNELMPANDHNNTPNIVYLPHGIYTVIVNNMTMQIIRSM